MTVFNDEFDRGDASSPGNGWTGYSSRMLLKSGAIVPPGTNTYVERAPVVMATGNHSSAFQMGNTYGGSFTGPCVRLPELGTSNSNTEAFYGFFLTGSTGTAFSIRRKEANSTTMTMLGSGNTPTDSRIEGLKMKLEVEETSSAVILRGYVNDVLVVQAQDASGAVPATQRGVGVYSSGTTAPSLRIARFASTDLSAAPEVDTTAPTVPSGIILFANDPTSTSISWNASTDNVGVASYRVQRNGVTIAPALTNRTYVDTGLSANTAYSYTVSAVDAAGNRSAESAAQTIRTSLSGTVTETDFYIWRNGAMVPLQVLGIYGNGRIRPVDHAKHISASPAQLLHLDPLDGMNHFSLAMSRDGLSAPVIKTGSEVSAGFALSPYFDASYHEPAKRYYNTFSIISAVNAATSLDGVLAALDPIEATYGFNVTVPATGSNVENISWTALTDLETIKNRVGALVQEVAKYPSAGVQSTPLSTVAITDGVSYMNSPGASIWSAATTTIFLDSRWGDRVFRKQFHHEYMHAAIYLNTVWDAAMQANFSAQNPSGSAFGASFTGDHPAGYMSDWARYNVTEDIADLHCFLMSDHLALLAKSVVARDAVVSRKVGLLRQALGFLSPVMSSVDFYRLAPSETRGVQMSARLDGPKLPGSNFTGTELKEVNSNGSVYTFNPFVGTHYIRGKMRIVHLPPNNPETVIAELNNGSGDRASIRAYLSNGVVSLGAFINGSLVTPRLMDPLVLNAEFEFSIRVVDGQLRIYYGSMRDPIITSTALLSTGSASWSFRVGVQNRSNSTSDLPSEYSRVIVRDLEHWHTGWPTVFNKAIESVYSPAITTTPTTPVDPAPTPTGTPATVLNIGTAPGKNHFSVQVAPNGGSTFVTKTQADIAAGYNEDPYFKVVNSGGINRVQFWARADGPTTSGSSFARSELRELDLNGTNMGFDAKDGGVHQLHFRARVTHLPPDDSEVCIAQLHNGDTERLAIRTTSNGDGTCRLVGRANGSQIVVFADNYVPNTEFEGMLEIVAGEARFYYNNMNVPAATSNALVSTGSSSWYQKVGNYNQFNETSASATEYASTEIRDLWHWHTGWPVPTGVTNPYHNQTSTGNPTGSIVTMWAGGLTSTGFTASATASGAPSAKLAVSTSADMSNPILAATTSTPDSAGYVKSTITGLTPNTKYYYAMQLGSGIDKAKIQSLRTAPQGASSFKFAFSSCDNANGVSAAYGRIKAHSPLFFLSVGDFHYADNATASETNYHNKFNTMLSASGSGPMLKEMAFDYTWSDHDFGPNNSYGTGGTGATVKPYAQSAYRKRVPHYSLPSATGGIYHTYVIGRVRFIVTDNRSYKSVQTATDNSSKTVLGAEQKTWFKNTITAATEPLIFWGNDQPFSNYSDADDEWPSYNTERTELANFIKASGKNVEILAGDMHAVGYDDGTNSLGIPVMHSSPLHQGASKKVNTLTWGPSPSSGTVEQYSIIEITDTGTAVTRKFTAYNNSNVVAYTNSKTYS